MQNLEKKIESGNIVINQKSSSGDKTSRYVSQDSNKKIESKPNTNNQEKAKLSDITSTEYWPKVINNLKSKGKITLFTNLINTKAVELNDMQLGIVGLTAFGKTVVEQIDNRKEIETAIAQEIGKTMQIKIEEPQNIVNKTKSQDFGIPINIIDE